MNKCLLALLLVLFPARLFADEQLPQPPMVVWGVVEVEAQTVQGYCNGRFVADAMVLRPSNGLILYALELPGYPDDDPGCLPREYVTLTLDGYRPTIPALPWEGGASVQVNLWSYSSYLPAIGLSF